MDIKKVIWIIVGIVVIVGAFFGLTVLSNITGNAITGSSINTPSIEQETFKISDNIGGIDNGSKSGSG